MSHALLAILVLLGACLQAQSILPPPPVPAGNPQTPAKVQLGKALFWDEQLSSTRSVACGTCHRFSQGGADPRTAVSVHPGPDGAFGTADDIHGSPGVAQHDSSGHLVAAPGFGVQVQVTARRAPSVVNAAYARSLFLDGRAADVFCDPETGAVVLASGAALENQIAGPPTNSREMAHLGRSWTDVAADLASRTPLALATNVPLTLQQFLAGHTYATLFEQVFGSPGVTPVRIVFALAAYERSLQSDRSPFDLYLAGQGTLSAAQLAGLARFQVHCAPCHTDLDPAVLATGPVLDDFRNIGVRPVAEDEGRAGITGLAADRGAFRVPGLRNVALRGSYFHNGGQPTLGAVVDYYARGGDFADNLDPLLPAMAGNLTLADRQQILALLQTLTDPRVAYELPPFDRPTLWSEGANVPYVFGSGTPGPGGVRPRIAADAPAFRGNPRFAVGADGLPAGAFTALVLDRALAPVPLTVAGRTVFLAMSPACVTFMPGLAIPSPDGSGHASLVFDLPPSTSVTGTWYAQWAAIDASVSSGFVTSNALSFTIF